MGLCRDRPYQLSNNGARLTKGIISLCNRANIESRDDWGALRAWAWGADQTADYLINKAVDSETGEH